MWSQISTIFSQSPIHKANFSHPFFTTEDHFSHITQFSFSLLDFISIMPPNPLSFFHFSLPPSVFFISPSFPLHFFLCFSFPPPPHFVFFVSPSLSPSSSCPSDPSSVPSSSSPFSSPFCSHSPSCSP